MSVVDRTLDRTVGLIERLSDRLNPILVKETRQSTQGTFFAMVFLLFISISWVVLTLGTLSQWERLETDPTAELFFGWYYAVLSFAAFVVVPFGAYRSLLVEREQHTYDLLTITTLEPRRIVQGKLSSSVLQILVYYSAIAPFIAFTSVLQGFDVLWVSWVLALSFLWSIALCTVAMMTSVSSRHGQWQTTNLVGLIVMLLIGWVTALSFVVVGDAQREMAQPFFWLVTGICVVLGFSYIALAQQVTISRITFASGNRSSGIRWILTIQFWLFVAAIALLSVVNVGVAMDEDAQLVVGTLATLHWTVAGLFLVTESEFLSRRIRSRFSTSRGRRLLSAPFLPGGSRGLVLVFGHLAILCLGMALLAGVLGVATARHARGLVGTFVLVLNAVVWLGVAAIISRWARKVSYRITNAHVRVLTVLLFVLVQFVSMVPMIITGRNSFSVIHALNPFVMVAEVDDAGRIGFAAGVAAMIILLFAAAVLLLVNLPAMYRGIRAVTDGPTPQPTPQHDPPEGSSGA